MYICYRYFFYVVDGFCMGDPLTVPMGGVRSDASGEEAEFDIVASTCTGGEEDEVEDEDGDKEPFTKREVDTDGKPLKDV